MAVLAEGRQFAHAKHGFTDGTGLNYLGSFCNLDTALQQPAIAAIVHRTLIGNAIITI